MFIDFFYKLKDAGIPVSPTSFLTLQRALSNGLVYSLDDFYVAARSILVKSERYFDLFDQLFAHQFEGAELPDDKGLEPGHVKCPECEGRGMVHTLAGGGVISD